MLDDTTIGLIDTDLRATELGALPLAPMAMRKQSLFGEDRSQPGFLTRLFWVLAPRRGHWG